jgi:hypothetical protein
LTPRPATKKLWDKTAYAFIPKERKENVRAFISLSRPLNRNPDEGLFHHSLFPVILFGPGMHRSAVEGLELPGILDNKILECGVPFY